MVQDPERTGTAYRIDNVRTVPYNEDQVFRRTILSTVPVQYRSSARTVRVQDSRGSTVRSVRMQSAQNAREDFTRDGETLLEQYK